MSVGLTLGALVVGFVVGSTGTVGVLAMWWGRRVTAYGLLGIGLWFVLGSLAGLALALWMLPVVSWGMTLLGTALGLWLVWLLARGRLSHEKC